MKEDINQMKVVSFKLVSIFSDEMDKGRLISYQEILGDFMHQTTSKDTFDNIFTFRGFKLPIEQ